MVEETDVVVLGLGGIGSAAAFWLARRGARVIALEQYALGHVRGASQDHSRLIRLSYGHADYVRLAQAAYASWADVAAEAGEVVVHETGGVDLFPRDSPMRRSDYHAAMDACGVEHELLDAAEAMRRVPELRLEDDVEVVFQPNGGVVAAAAANAAHQRLARFHGADLRSHTRVEALSTAGGEIVLRTSDDCTIRAGELVVCAGPWTGDVLAMLGQRLNITVTREQVVYLEPVVPEPFEIGRFPVWIWFGPDTFYGFPIFGEAGAVKVAQDLGGYETTAAGRDFDIDNANLARVRGFVRRHLPRAAGRERLVKTCLYTLTPDRDFIIDRVPGEEHVHFAVGCGHAFKFSTQIGRMFADLALDGTTPHDLTLFRSDRSVLSDAER